jgi:diacylglycerol kinase (ATP)
MKVREHWTIIYNPTSGTYRPQTLDRIQRALRDVGVRTVALGTDYAGHAVELCRSMSGTDRVACYSGDGTLNEVATGLLGRDFPIAFLPGGTANVMAHELGLPRDPIKAALALQRGSVRKVHPGRAGPWNFLLMAGLGFDATAVRLVSPRLKSYVGKGAYVWAGLQALFTSGTRLRMTMADGQHVETRWIVAARARKYGGPFVIHPEAGLEAETLGIAAVGPGQTIPFLVANLGMGLSGNGAGRRLSREAHIVVESDEPVDLQIDGDYRGKDSRFEIGIADAAIRLCFPER